MMVMLQNQQWSTSKAHLKVWQKGKTATPGMMMTRMIEMMMTVTVIVIRRMTMMMVMLQNQQWSTSKAHLKAWQKGKTGYPLVDAAMRQLWLTGWMNNYMRHVVASFLISYLRLNWTHGYEWFQVSQPAYHIHGVVYKQFVFHERLIQPML